MVLLKQKLKIDDALDAFGCHGIGGIWGGIATGLFGKTSVNSVARWNGLVFGDFHLFTAQLISILVTIAVAVCGTLICIGIVRIFTPLRVDVSAEISGLDFSQHGEMHIRPLTDLIHKRGGVIMLIKIEAIVREEKFEQVKSALQDIQVNGVTISQVMGYGTQRGYTEIVRGSEVDILLHPKIKFEVVVSSEEWEQKTISAIQKAAFTGEVGDGKIFSYEIRSAVKIRTKETGYNAVQSQDNL